MTTQPEANQVPLAQPECSHRFVRDEEAVKHYCCQTCGTVSHEQFVRWYAGQAAHGIKGEA